MPPSSTSFEASGLTIRMEQNNVSNAFKIEGKGFELTGNMLQQIGPCIYPNYGPLSDHSPFQPSTTVYLHASQNGLISNNVLYWRCSAYDLDTSDNVVFENNTIICTEPKVVPHGNSLSTYDTHNHPSSIHWSVARNSWSRPPYTKGTEQNWRQRETLTTDGGGSFGSGKITSITGNSIEMDWLVWSTQPAIGTSALILNGTGMGQIRTVTGTTSNTTIQLDRPFDKVAMGESLIAIIATSGRKIITGNYFNWTEVVQWYGITTYGVHSYNSFDNCNVLPAGGDDAGALQAVGECYHSPSHVFFTEFLHNKMYNSDGITIKDNGESTEPQCKDYPGPWIRWLIVRQNAFSGVSEAAKNVSASSGMPANCASSVSIAHPNVPSTDIVMEHDTFSCPPGNYTAGGYRMGNCSHCVVRQ
eukprot:m.240925 g.240925  ORF g.240925 m.240925 type:complete len:416 (+) comp16083_c1_seq25:254-1501(+)